MNTNEKTTDKQTVLITVTAIALSGCADMSATGMNPTDPSYSTVRKASDSECEGELLSTDHIDVVFDRLLKHFPEAFTHRGKSRYANVSKNWRLRALEYQVIPGIVYTVSGFIPNDTATDRWMQFDIQHNPMGGSVIRYNTLGYSDCADIHRRLDQGLVQGVDGSKRWSAS